MDKKSIMDKKWYSWFEREPQYDEDAFKYFGVFEYKGRWFRAVRHPSGLPLSCEYCMFNPKACQALMLQNKIPVCYVGSEKEPTHIVYREIYDADTTTGYFGEGYDKLVGCVPFEITNRKQIEKLTAKKLKELEKQKKEDNK